MGLFQGFRDRLFIQNAIDVLKGTAPQCRSVASEFCVDYADYILEARAKGLSPENALNDTCARILGNLGTRAIEKNELTDLLTAYCTSVIYREPMSVNGQFFLAVFKRLELSIPFNPYSDDSYVKWQQQQLAM